MSELKVYVPQDGPYGLVPEEGGSPVEEETCYLKSKVDELIAEKNEEIAELQSQVHDYVQGLYEIQASVEKELRHQKYKRCLIIISNIKAAMDNGFCVSGEYLDWMNKWHERWLKIAEKFKEVNNVC